MINKKIILGSLLSILLITGCDYSKEETNKTTMSTDNGVSLNVEKSTKIESDILDKPLEVKQNIKVSSDGTEEGTKSNFSFSVPTTEEIFSSAKSIANSAKEKSIKYAEIAEQKGLEYAKVAQGKITEYYYKGKKYASDELQKSWEEAKQHKKTKETNE